MDFPKINIGDRVSIRDRYNGVVKYIGIIEKMEGIWVGIELDTDGGKNDGTYNGRRYFNCPRNRGIFVKYRKILNSFGYGNTGKVDYRDTLKSSMTVDEIINKYSNLLEKEKKEDPFEDSLIENTLSTPTYNSFYSTIPKLPPDDYNPEMINDHLYDQKSSLLRGNYSKFLSRPNSNNKKNIKEPLLKDDIKYEDKQRSLLENSSFSESEYGEFINKNKIIIILKSIILTLFYYTLIPIKALIQLLDNIFFIRYYDKEELPVKILREMAEYYRNRNYYNFRMLYFKAVKIFKDSYGIDLT